ncbi:unnamed protein product, partial [Trichogramma brassicae]
MACREHHHHCRRDQRARSTPLSFISFLVFMQLIGLQIKFQHAVFCGAYCALTHIQQTDTYTHVRKMHALLHRSCTMFTEREARRGEANELVRACPFVISEPRAPREVGALTRPISSSGSGESRCAIYIHRQTQSWDLTVCERCAREMKETEKLSKLALSLCGTRIQHTYTEKESQSQKGNLGTLASALAFLADLTMERTGGDDAIHARGYHRMFHGYRYLYALAELSPPALAPQQVHYYRHFSRLCTPRCRWWPPAATAAAAIATAASRAPETSRERERNERKTKLHRRPFMQIYDRETRVSTLSRQSSVFKSARRIKCSEARAIPLYKSYMRGELTNQFMQRPHQTPPVGERESSAQHYRRARASRQGRRFPAYINLILLFFDSEDASLSQASVVAFDSQVNRAMAALLSGVRVRAELRVLFQKRREQRRRRAGCIGLYRLSGLLKKSSSSTTTTTIAATTTDGITLRAKKKDERRRRSSSSSRREKNHCFEKVLKAPLVFVSLLSPSGFCGVRFLKLGFVKRFAKR